MRRHKSGSAGDVAYPGSPSAALALTPDDGMIVRSFSSATEADALRLIRDQTARWHYCRPVDAKLIAHWKALGRRYQPGNMLVAYRDGGPCCFLHGERDGDEHFVHLLALAPGGVDDAVSLLGLVEARARSRLARRICGPTCVSGRFYGGYVLGLEPYHPHWAVDVTDVFVQAGFAITQSEVLMVADLSHLAPLGELPVGYQAAEGAGEPEFEARVFRLVVLREGQEVATCGGRLYPSLLAANGGPIGQLGFVGTEEQHRGRGLATALVTRALRRLSEWGAAMALVSTGLENGAALRAYERAGFRRRHSLTEWSKLL